MAVVGVTRLQGRKPPRKPEDRTEQNWINLRAADRRGLTQGVRGRGPRLRVRVEGRTVFIPRRWP